MQSREPLVVDYGSPLFILAGLAASASRISVARGILWMSVISAADLNWIRSELDQGKDLPNGMARRLLNAYEVTVPGPARDKMLRDMAKDPFAQKDVPPR
jgi:hypothetical protein